MKRLIISGAVLSGICTGAFGQSSSSVTLYGRLDVSVNYDRYSGQGRTDSLKSVSSDSSMFGFRGSEDLGDGKRAYFKMESWFNADTGALFNPTTFWSREVYAGVGDARLGSVQLGSQYLPSLWIQLKTDPFQRFNNGGAFQLTQQVPGFPRGWVSTAPNAVQYVSPVIAGFQARAVYGAGEGSATGHIAGAGVEYTAGKFFAGASVDRVRTLGTSLGLPDPTYRNRNFTLGVKYNFGPMTAHGYYLHNRVDTQPDVDVYLVGATIPVGPGEIRTSYTHRNARDAANSDASVFAAGYFYFLSKRTTLYTSVARLANDGSSKVGLWPSSGAAAAQGLPLAGQDVTGLQVGIRHNF